MYSILEYTANDGKKYKTRFYNLDAILSVGYRVNSINATMFRKWANSVLSLLDKRERGVKAMIYTRQIIPQLQLDIQRHDSQYEPIPVYVLKFAHDRFLLLDEDVYHIGASIKDVGKRWFAIMKMVETKADEIIRHLETPCYPSL